VATAPGSEPQIRSLISTYAQAVTARDVARWRDTWIEDCTWELLGQTHAGRAAATAHLEAVLGGLAFVYQLPGEAAIVVDAGGDRATGRVPTVELAKFGEGPGTLLLGTYHDVYVWEAGGWRFAERRMELQYMGPTDLSGATS